MSIAPAATSEPAQVERGIRWKHWLILLLVIVLIGAVADLLGWNIRGWLKHVWDTVTSISAEYVIAACVLVTIQTAAVAYAYFSILRFGFPRANVRFLVVFATYAASVALNSILPANLGSLVLLLMFTAVFAGVTFAGAVAVYGVQKIFFVVVGAFPYLYLFFSVHGSFDMRFGFIRAHPWATAVVVVGAVVLIVLLVRTFWTRVLGWWEQIKEGGQILVHPGKYFLRVFLPQAVSWVSYLGVLAIFLAAYSIPVTFEILMRVVAYGSVANVTSVTPGGAGVQQAFSVAALSGVTSSTNATAYSVAQQLVTTAWGLILAVVLMSWAFGWSGGKELVAGSYAKAKQTQAEQKAARKEKRLAKLRRRDQAAPTD